MHNLRKYKEIVKKTDLLVRELDASYASDLLQYIEWHSSNEATKMTPEVDIVTYGLQSILLGGKVICLADCDTNTQNIHREQIGNTVFNILDVHNRARRGFLHPRSEIRVLVLNLRKDYDVETIKYLINRHVLQAALSIVIINDKYEYILSLMPFKDAVKCQVAELKYEHNYNYNIESILEYQSDERIATASSLSILISLAKILRAIAEILANEKRDLEARRILVKSELHGVKGKAHLNRLSTFSADLKSITSNTYKEFENGVLARLNAMFYEGAGNTQAAIADYVEKNLELKVIHARDKELFFLRKKYFVFDEQIIDDLVMILDNTIVKFTQEFESAKRVFNISLRNKLDSFANDRLGKSIELTGLEVDLSELSNRYLKTSGFTRKFTPKAIDISFRRLFMVVREPVMYLSMIIFTFSMLGQSEQMAQFRKSPVFNVLAGILLFSGIVYARINYLTAYRKQKDEEFRRIQSWLSMEFGHLIKEISKDFATLIKQSVQSCLQADALHIESFAKGELLIDEQTKSSRLIVANRKMQNLELRDKQINRLDAELRSIESNLSLMLEETRSELYK